MRFSRVESIGRYLGPQVVTTDEVMAGLANPMPIELERITGIHSRRVKSDEGGEQQTSATFAIAAIEDCLARSAYKAADIDIVISTSITRSTDQNSLVQRTEPTMAAYIARQIGATAAQHFDVSNACAGMVSGIYILDRMIKAGIVRNGLVVSGEIASDVLRTAQAEIDSPFHPQFASLTLGDAAACVLLDKSTGPQDRINYIELISMSNFSELCIGKPSILTSGPVVETDAMGMQHPDRLRAWAHFAQDFLDAKGTTLEEENHDHLILHQVSQRVIRSWPKAMEGHLQQKLPETTIVCDRYGNNVSAALFVALYEYLEKCSAESDTTKKVMIVPAASGLVTGVMSINFSGLEI